MSLDEFNLQMARLRVKFGVKVYDEETTKLVWKGLSRLPDGIFTDAVDLAIGELKPAQAPMLPELINLTQRAMDKRTRPKVTHVPCTECGHEGLGYMLFHNPDHGGQMLAACSTCHNGKELTVRGYKTTSEAYAKGFTALIYPRDGRGEKQHTPWPASLEGLFYCMRSKSKKGISFGLKYNNLALDEAEYLLKVAREKRFDDEWANELLDKLPHSKPSLVITEKLKTGAV